MQLCRKCCIYCLLECTKGLCTGYKPAINKERWRSCHSCRSAILLVFLYLCTILCNIKAVADIIPQIPRPLFKIICAQACLVAKYLIMHLPVSLISAFLLYAFRRKCSRQCKWMEIKREVSKDNLDFSSIDIRLLDLWESLAPEPLTEWALVIREFNYCYRCIFVAKNCIIVRCRLYL